MNKMSQRSLVATLSLEVLFDSSGDRLFKKRDDHAPTEKERRNNIIASSNSEPIHLKCDYLIP